MCLSIILKLLTNNNYDKIKHGSDLMTIENIDDLLKQTNISDFVRAGDIVKGKNYNKEIVKTDVRPTSSVYGNIIYYHFQVDSQTKPTYYDVSIYIENGQKIVKTLCDCRGFRSTNSCKHIAAVFFKYYEDLFASKIVNVTKNI